MKELKKFLKRVPQPVRYGVFLFAEMLCIVVLNNKRLSVAGTIFFSFCVAAITVGFGLLRKWFRKSGKPKKLLALARFSGGLVLMCGMAYLFTFYLDGDIGVVIWSFLIIAPLLSFLLGWSAKQHIRAKLEAPDCLPKGRQFEAAVILTADGRLPIPFLRCRMEQSSGIVPEDSRPVQTSMLPAEPLRIPSAMTAKYAGRSEISLGTFEIYDYLGLFRYTVQQFPEPVRVGIIPEIPALSGASVLLHTVSDVVQTQDDEEEESAAPVSCMSMPGYVHRDYVPGDSLRRINWKLSARRSRLMVRMDEAAATVRPAVLLDLHPENTEQGMRYRDTLMEGALGLLLLLVRQGIPCSLHFAGDGEWQSIEMDTEEAVHTAALALAVSDFTHGDSRFDSGILSEKAGAFLVFSSAADAGLADMVNALHAKGYVSCVLPAAMPLPSLPEADTLWQIGEDFTMTAVQK